VHQAEAGLQAARISAARDPGHNFALSERAAQLFYSGFRKCTRHLYEGQEKQAPVRAEGSHLLDRQRCVYKHRRHLEPQAQAEVPRAARKAKARLLELPGPRKTHRYLDYRHKERTAVAAEPKQEQHPPIKRESTLPLQLPLSLSIFDGS